MTLTSPETQESAAVRNVTFVGSVAPKEHKDIRFELDGEQRSISYAKFDFAFPDKWDKNKPGETKEYILVLPYKSPLDRFKYVIEIYRYDYNQGLGGSGETWNNWSEYFGVLRPTERSVSHIIGPIIEEGHLGGL